MKGDFEMEFVTYEVEGAVGLITINRPQALNALNSQVLEELDEAFAGVDLNTARNLLWRARTSER